MMRAMRRKVRIPANNRRTSLRRFWPWWPQSFLDVILEELVVEKWRERE
jgi:hypothetical protein